MKWYEVLFLVMVLYLAFVCGFARANMVEDVFKTASLACKDTQQVVVVADKTAQYLYDNWKSMLKDVIPHDDIEVYITDQEIGIIWTF